MIFQYKKKKLNKNNQITRINQILEKNDSWSLERSLRTFIEIYELDEDVIRMLFTFMPRPWWNYVVQNQKLSENFMREFADKIDMKCVGTNQTISEEFIKEMKDKLSFFTIARYHRLSEDFIRKHHDEMDWKYISRDQDMTEEFIEEYKDKIYWLEYFYRNRNVDMLSEQFIERHLNDIFYDSEVVNAFLWKRDAPLSKKLQKELEKRADET